MFRPRRKRPITTTAAVLYNKRKTRLVAASAVLCTGMFLIFTTKPPLFAPNVLPPQLRASAATTTATNNHQHAIPNIIIFTHRYNLLDTDVVQELTLSSEEERNELLALQRNVRHSISLHAEARVRFLTDDDCVKSIRAVLGDDTPLVQYFLSEPQGMFKADVCRGAAMVETGGLYFDVDLGVRMNLWEVLRTNTTFATVRVHPQSTHRGAFFQAFIGATPGHAILQRYVELFLQYYQGKLGSIDGPLGVLLLKRAFDEILDEEGPDEAREATVSEEKSSNKTFDVSVADTTEIWQEVLYIPELQKTLLKDIPPPTWGTRRACKFITITSPTFPVTVPFYSRITGSRMCPPSENQTQTHATYHEQQLVNP
jgi:hypothetical protein